MNKIDLNCDLGESFGDYVIGSDSLIIPCISSANIACAYHAGDAITMDKTVKLCKNHNVSIGAHPGLPDLLGFGRRNMAITPLEAKLYVQHQMSSLMGFCKKYGVPLQHVKPHGALYNMAGKDYSLAKGICEGIAEIDSNIILLALSGSEMVNAAKAVGIPVAKEVFADRAYEEDGSLVKRGTPGAMITDENSAIARVIRMIKEKKVTSITGKDIDIDAQSICVHGDGEKALLFVKKILCELEKDKIQIAPLKDII